MEPAEAQALIDQATKRKPSRRATVLSIAGALSAGAEIVALRNAFTRIKVPADQIVWGAGSTVFLTAGIGSVIVMGDRSDNKRMKLHAEEVAQKAMDEGRICDAANIMLARLGPGIVEPLHNDGNLWAQGVQFVFSHPEFFEPDSPGGKSYGEKLVDEIVGTLMSKGRGKTVRLLAEHPIDLTTDPKQAARIYEAMAYGAALHKRTAGLSIDTVFEVLTRLKDIDSDACDDVARAYHIAAQRRLAPVLR